MFPFPIKPGPIPSRYHMHWQYLAQNSADPCIDTLGSWVDERAHHDIKDHRHNPQSLRPLPTAWPPSKEPHIPPQITLHGRMWASRGRSKHSSAKLAGWLASWSSLAAPARSSSRQGRRGSQKIFLEITCIVSKSCELGKGNGFVDPGRAGRFATLTLLLNSSESFHQHRPFD